jgi:hypothetical protein
MGSQHLRRHTARCSWSTAYAPGVYPTGAACASGYPAEEEVTEGVLAAIQRGPHFRQPAGGLGFDGLEVAHMWRTMIWPNNFL